MAFLVKAVIFLACILEALLSNLNTDTDNSDSYRGFLKSLQANSRIEP